MKKLGLAVLLGAGLALAPVGAGAQVALGPQLSVGTDSDVGIGGRLLLGLEDLVANMEGIASFDWFFPDGDVDWWELNGNVAIPVPVSSGFEPYLGGGLNLTSVSVDSPVAGDRDDTEVGFNVLAGVKFPSGGATPFFELRATIAGGEQVVLTGGVLFGRSR